MSTILSFLQIQPRPNGSSRTLESSWKDLTSQNNPYRCSKLAKDRAILEYFAWSIIIGMYTDILEIEGSPTRNGLIIAMNLALKSTQDSTFHVIALVPSRSYPYNRTHVDDRNVHCRMLCCLPHFRPAIVFPRTK